MTRAQLLRRLRAFQRGDSWMPRLLLLFALGSLVQVVWDCALTISTGHTWYLVPMVINAGVVCIQGHNIHRIHERAPQLVDAISELERIQVYERQTKPRWN